MLKSLAYCVCALNTFFFCHNLRLHSVFENFHSYKIPLAKVVTYSKKSVRSALFLCQKKSDKISIQICC